MSPHSILFLLLCSFVAINGIGYYTRNIARKSYWLMANNLDRVNTTAHPQFWAIVDDEKATKKEILKRLGQWAEANSAYMVEQYERMIVYEKKLYEIAEEFSVELVHTSEASKLAKRLYQVHADRNLSWKQTCRKKNQMIRLAGREVQNELKLQLNAWCLPKPTPKRSALLPSQ
ncbi:hypothetical protein M3Y99_00914500 [Aphelenchoides fujianensis]|nr:hypothetical protein M3Y99_00914500 [Aphelenchoides fujianensis]